MFDDFLAVLDDGEFEEIPVDIDTFIRDERYLNRPEFSLSPIQRDAVLNSTQIYRKETLESYLSPEEAQRRWRQTNREVILMLGKGCAVYDDEVYDGKTGLWTKIGDMQGSFDNTVVSMNDDGYLVHDFGTESWVKGRGVVRKVTTARGLSMTVAAEHKFITKGGNYTSLADLRMGDKIATVATLPEPNSPVRLDDREVELLGFWLGDGMMPADHNKTLNMDFSEYEENSLLRYIEICRSYGVEPTVRKHPTKKMYHVRVYDKTPIFEIVRRHGLWNKRAHDKEIPSAIFSLPNDQLALFVSRLHGTDGCIYMKKCANRYQPVIEYTSISEKLAIGYQRILARFGVVAGLRSRIPSYTYKGERKQGQRAYYLTVSSKEGFERFAKAVIMLDKQSKIDEGLSILQTMKGITSAYEGDIYWDKVKSIEEVGSEEFFTLTAADNHNYVANLIMNGNSGK